MQCDDLELDRFHVPSSERHLHTQPKKPNRGPKVGIAVFGHETYDLGCGPCACENVKSKRNWLSSLDVWMSLLSCRVLLNVPRSLTLVVLTLDRTDRTPLQNAKSEML